MWKWLFIGVCIGKVTQSFLQQDEEENIVALGEADYDLVTYEIEGEEKVDFLLENFNPEGESSPENDYLLVQYKKIIEYIFLNHFVISQNETLTDDTVTVVDGEIISIEDTEESTGPTGETRGDTVEEILNDE